MALLRNGYPRFATIRQYAGAGASTNEVIRFARAATWAACSPGKRSRAIATAGRDRCWSRASCIRPTPKRRCRSASRASGCRTMAAARSRRWRRRSTCCRRSSSAVGKKATVVLDSGIRSGQDVMRALALGAKAAFAGKSFLWAVGALGDDGPGAPDRPLHRRIALLARPDRRPFARRGARRGHPVAIPAPGASTATIEILTCDLRQWWISRRRR